eukprot:1362209-Prymnesium_polylepis.1
MHGDLKMINIVRDQRDQRVRIIDFDGFAKFSHDKDDSDYAGVKFSSGTLSPEMFHQIGEAKEVDQLREYWSECNDALQKKVAPLRTKKGRAYVVKSFRTTDESTTEPADVNKLPYSPVSASDKIDVWALGVMAYYSYMFTGAPLVPLTRNDDCATGSGMAFIHRWGADQDEVRDALARITEPAARDLVD